MADAGVALKFTAKERDAESGLDYFGARYFSGPQGRFTSPDPLLNSGRPWIPQSWNRYTYVLNNPLQYNDPTGLYEWAEPCALDDRACNNRREQFRRALEEAKKQAAKYKSDSDERKKLDAVLKRIGEEGQGGQK